MVGDFVAMGFTLWAMYAMSKKPVHRIRSKRNYYYR